MSIHEPATLLTDYLLALLGAVLIFPHFVIAIVDYGLTMLSWAGAAMKKIGRLDRLASARAVSHVVYQAGPASPIA
jgi:hypothetical protein